MMAKIFGLFNGLTFGLLKYYRRKSMQVIKIAAVKMYLKGLKAIRRHVLILCLAIFCMVTLAVTVVVVPVSLLMMAPWNLRVKATLLAVFGVAYVAAGIAAVLSLFSEKHWMQLTGSEELVDEVANKNETKA